MNKRSPILNEVPYALDVGCVRTIKLDTDGKKK